MKLMVSEHALVPGNGAEEHLTRAGHLVFSFETHLALECPG